jgi:signal transduction histidine kinase
MSVANSLKAEEHIMGLFLRTYFEDVASTKKSVINTESLFRAAHDLRSPLSALNFTIHHFKKLSPHLEHLDLLDETIRRINSIAEDILQARHKISVVETGSFELISTLQYLSREARFQLHNKIEVVGADMLPTHPIQVRGDVEDFTRILWNMVQNSIEAGATKVTLSCLEDKGSVILKIKDNGRGIPAEFISKLGQEGFTTKNKGNGLGLYSAFQKLRAWNGELSITSRQDLGTNLEIRLSYS